MTGSSKGGVVASMKRESPGIYRSVRGIVLVGKGDVARLKRIAVHGRLQRSRLCVHPNDEAPLHEMFIVHRKGVYVRPHRHPGKSESYHVIEGRADLVFFDQRGRVSSVRSLGPPSSGGHFYCRINDSHFHTLLVRSVFFVFHEVTTGPFRRNKTDFARWAPAANDSEAQRMYLDNLEVRVHRMTRSNSERRALDLF